MTARFVLGELRGSEYDNVESGKNNSNPMDANFADEESFHYALFNALKKPR